jgi:hypothetical protein
MDFVKLTKTRAQVSGGMAELLPQQSCSFGAGEAATRSGA